MGLFDKLKQKEQAPAPVISSTGTEIGAKGVLSIKENKKEPNISEILMSQNRAQRRGFAREYGIMLPGSTKPFINTKKKK